MFVCDGCAEMIGTIIEKRKGSKKGAKSETDKGKNQRLSYLEEKETEELFELLGNVERTHKSIDSHQQIVVDLLRSRRIRWVEIGDVLGVTRQAAWQRFGAAD